MMFSLNSQQKKLIGAFAIAASGPITTILVKKLGLAPEDVKMYFDLLAAFTLLLGGGFGVSFATDSAQVANVPLMAPAQQALVAAVLPVEAKAADAATLGPHDALQMANALPDKATIAAVNAMPDVTDVLVKANAKDGVGEALRDESLGKVTAK